MILGPYEKGAPACFVDGVPPTFEKDLLPGDIDRLLPHVEAAAHRVPSFENAGIKDVVNGPISYSPRRQSAGRTRVRSRELLDLGGPTGFGVTAAAARAGSSPSGS